MIITGAGGHAKDLLTDIDIKNRPIVFFDESPNRASTLYLDRFEIISSLDDLATSFKTDPHFILGVGTPKNRILLFKKCSNAGGKLFSTISKSAVIGDSNVSIGAGVNIMPFVFVSNNVRIGEGSLINTRANIHHDVTIGTFCDISPGALILGGVTIGNESWVGAGAVILPNVKVGNNCTIGAGAVVTRDIKDHETMVGNPAIAI